MSAFNDYLTKIKTAVYGKDVRGAIHDALSYLHKNSSGTYTLPTASKTTLGGIKIGDDFAVDKDSKLNLASDKVVQKTGYSDDEILSFLHIDLSKNVTPVPLLGSWFKLATDDEGNITGLDFSTNGRIKLLKFINDAIIALELHKTKDAPIELDSLGNAYSVYYRLSIMDNPSLFSAFNGNADGAFVTAHCIEDEQLGKKYVQIAVPVAFNYMPVPCIATRSKTGDNAWSDWSVPGIGGETDG